MSSSRATIVVPCFNEEARLRPPEFRSFLATTHGIDFLFVNDGSTDATATLLARLEESQPRGVRVLELDRNRGKAEAVRRGVLAALASDSDYVGFWDADLATPLATILRFMAVLDERSDIDIVIGSRVQLLGRTIERKAVRHYMGRLFATVVSLMLGIPVYDTQCGAKLFRRGEELGTVFAEPFHSRWVFDVEILARLIGIRRGRAIPQVEQIVYEYPLQEWRDIAGTKLRLRDFARAVPELWQIYRSTLRSSVRPGSALPLARGSVAVPDKAPAADRPVSNGGRSSERPAPHSRPLA